MKKMKKKHFNFQIGEIIKNKYKVRIIFLIIYNIYSY